MILLEAEILPGIDLRHWRILRVVPRWRTLYDTWFFHFQRTLFYHGKEAVLQIGKEELWDWQMATKGHFEKGGIPKIVRSTFEEDGRVESKKSGRPDYSGY